MKNLAKIFITVVAGMLAFSCVTDTTEDQAVQLGTGQTTLSISLDGTRTHLGENTGDGYPLYWSAGDKVAVNGYTSAEIASQYVGTSGAEFTFNTSELGDTYNLVYPAPAEDVTASATVVPGAYPNPQGLTVDGKMNIGGEVIIKARILRGYFERNL